MAKQSHGKNKPRGVTGFLHALIFGEHRTSLLVTSCMLVGIAFLVISQAATTNFSIEPETGTKSPAAAVITSSQASGGAAVRFSDAASGFVHPGILVNKAQLDFTKAKIAAGQQPWLNAYNQLKGSFLASKSYTPKPVPKLQCTTSGLLADYAQLGCTDINNDSAAVYAQALMWYYTGDAAYANKAVEIMNAWSTTLKEVPLDDPNGSDPKNDAEFFQSRLILGWSAESIIRGAEIIRHTSTNWASADSNRFEGMLRTIYYPHLAEGWTGTGNGAGSWADGLVNMGIFMDDRTIFNLGIQHWKQNTRSMVYLTSDGATPIPYLSPRDNKNKTPNYWTVTRYINGLESETCRDMGHAYMGLGAMANTAETARLQGVDLYGDPEFKNRFLASFELNADYVNQMLDQMATTGQTVAQVTSSTWTPANFPCSDFKDGGGSAFLGQELAYNHFANRLGIAMPNTKKLLDRKRPQAGGNHLFFETLTHYSAP